MDYVAIGGVAGIVGFIIGWWCRVLAAEARAQSRPLGTAEWTPRR